MAKQNVAEKILADIGQSVSANSTEGDLAIQENLLQPDFETSPQLSEETSLPERSLINYGDIAFAEDETIDFTSDDIPMCGLRTLQPIPERKFISLSQLSGYMPNLPLLISCNFLSARLLCRLMHNDQHFLNLIITHVYLPSFR